MASAKRGRERSQANTSDSLLDASSTRKSCCVGTTDTSVFSASCRGGKLGYTVRRGFGLLDFDSVCVLVDLRGSGTRIP